MGILLDKYYIFITTLITIAEKNNHHLGGLESIKVRIM